MQQDSYVHQKCGVSQACGLHCNQLGNIQSVRRVSEEPFIVYMCQVVKLACRPIPLAVLQDRPNTISLQHYGTAVSLNTRVG